MKIRHFYLALLSFFFFCALLLAEYFLCSALFRFLRPSDSLKVDGVCLLVAPLLCYGLFRKAAKAALREKIPSVAVVGSFFLFSLLLVFFLRFGVQLANGWLDPSEPESHVVIITGKDISAFGGNITEGLNPMAHMVHFHADWDDGGGECALWTPDDFYFSVDTGSFVQISLRQGFFHLPWVEDFQALDTRLLPGTGSGPGKTGGGAF